MTREAAKPPVTPIVREPAWIEVCISATRDATPAIEEALEALGALAVTLEDDHDDPVLEPGAGETPLWPAVRVRGLFEADADRARVAATLQSLGGLERPEALCWRVVAGRDWTRAWLDRFRPMRFGRRLWVVPGGMEPPPEPEAVVVRLDPGLAFGTGTHPTTALCLEWLDGADVAASTVLDYGCGSGILGVAAARLDAARVLCVDNDPQALEATASNAERNGVSGKVICLEPGPAVAIDADIVLANILAGPLVALADELVHAARPGGAIVLSGILEEQVAGVCSAYAPACEQRSIRSREGWSMVELIRKQA